jgi:hypothetical protein
MVLTLLAGLSACSLPPSNADSDLRQLASVKLLSTPPPHGVSLGSTEDKGSTSIGSARAPAIVHVFASSEEPTAIADYYRSTYPEYTLSINCCETAQHVTLGGTSTPSWIVMSVYIQADKPSIPAPYDVALSKGPGDANTFVTVLVIGQP